MSSLEMIITSRERDLGGFSVRRILPYVSRRMVGPFIFFDHMGPATFPPGQGIMVRPHPHINLATVTYLFEGRILHRDSLGSKQSIEPGAINWMTAGRGIVHSERAVPEDLERGSRLNGIQCWVALPKEHEEIEPSFHHHPSTTLPEFTEGKSRLKLLLGSAYGRRSPVNVHSDLFYLEALVPAGERLRLPNDGREGAAYLVSGALQVEEQTIDACSMLIAKNGQDLEMLALSDCRVMLLGGSPLGERLLYWNFVSSSAARMEEAKAEWAQGPGTSRFPKIPDDHDEFIPLPETPRKGTSM